MYLKYFITQNAFLFSQTHSVTETKTPHVTKKDARETEKKADRIGDFTVTVATAIGSTHT